jgi:hypothetical protein
LQHPQKPSRPATGEDAPRRPYEKLLLFSAKRVHDHRRQGNSALAGGRLEGADRTEPVGALAHVELAPGQIDVGPARTVMLRLSAVWIPAPPPSRFG